MASRSSRRRRPVRAKAWVPAALLVLLLTGGYVTADAFDVAPGPLTLSNPWPDAEPFPTPHLPSATPHAALSLDPAAPTPAKEAVEELVAEFAADPLVGPDPGVLITVAQTGDVLGELNPDAPMVPASTTKLLTAVAALDSVGAGYTFRTNIVDGAGGDPDGITLVGSGDLTLGAGEGDPEAAIGRGGLETLAAEVATELTSQGRTTITDLAVDDTLWEGPRLAPRWEDRDLIEGWGMPMAPLAIDLGKISGQLARSTDPAGDAARAVADALADHGIEMTGEVRTEPAPDSAQVLGTVESAPLREIVEYMLVYSDNVLAEGIGRLAAVSSGFPGSFEGAGEAITARLKELGVPTEGLHLADSSGLSSKNRISPRTLVGAMGTITHGEHPALLTTIRALPIAGLEGTLRERMRGTPAAGAVVAKTGSLLTTATIAGQVHTREGRMLHVAIMTHGWDSSLTQARAGIDRLLEGLAACGCLEPGTG